MMQITIIILCETQFDNDHPIGTTLYVDLGNY